MYRLTYWLNPTEMIKTVKGRITALEWLKNECDRIKAKGKQAYIRDGNETTNFKGKFCLMVEDIPPLKSLGFKGEKVMSNKMSDFVLTDNDDETEEEQLEEVGGAE